MREQEHRETWLNADQSAEIGALAKALALAQVEVRGAPRSTSDPRSVPRDSDLSETHDAYREALAKHGLAIVQTTDVRFEGVVLLTHLLHASGQWIRGVCPVEYGPRERQADGSALARARFDALCAIVGVLVHDNRRNGTPASGSAGVAKDAPLDAPESPAMRRRPARTTALVEAGLRRLLAEADARTLVAAIAMKAKTTLPNGVYLAFRSACAAKYEALVRAQQAQLGAS